MTIPVNPATPPRDALDDWIIESSLKDVSEWVDVRLAGVDGRWHERDGERPSELILYIVRAGSEDVGVKLLFAVAELLRVELDGASARTGLVSQRLDTLFEVIRGVDELPKNPAAREIVHLLDAAVTRAVEKQPRSAFLKAVLLARAGLMPPLSIDVWKPMLLDAEMAFYAFRCAAVENGWGVATEAYSCWARVALMSARDDADRARITDELVLQGRLLQHHHPREMETSLRSLRNTKGPIGTVAEIIMDRLMPLGNFGGKVKVAAFVSLPPRG